MLRTRSRLAAAILAAAGAMAPIPVLAQQASPASAHADSAQAWAANVWEMAGKGDPRVFEALDQVPDDAPNGDVLREAITSLKRGFVERESMRQERIAELHSDIEKILGEALTDAAISEGLVHLVELQLISQDKGAMLDEPRVQDLIAKAVTAARDAEVRGDWLTANELFYRLDQIFEQEGTYHEELARQGHRLEMIRLYDPARFWQMRNDQRLRDGEDALPPYNPLGDDYHAKLQDVSQVMVGYAINRTAKNHVNSDTDSSLLLVGALRYVRDLVTLDDLNGVFPGLKDQDARARMLGYVDRQLRAAEREAIDPVGYDRLAEIDRVMGELLALNDVTVKLPREALLHEFGNGAMTILTTKGDQFSAIIWPDELRRFERSTRGNFVGVGIQIQMNEESNIEVVTPLEGTPAQKAGVLPKDVIIKVDGESTAGFSLDQAVENITGPRGTEVVLTVERGEDGATIEKDLRMVRDNIKLESVRGWARVGKGEDEWDWFIDHDARIGYVRLGQFSEETTQDFDRAITAMKAKGVDGLILDLRYNPGGLLDQAVGIVSRFVDGRKVVETRNERDREHPPEFAKRGFASLAHLPVVVLVNESSASASEIVSGAIQDYAEDGLVKALVLGRRSYGKGSVQNVWGLPGNNAAMKLTTQLYALPKGRLIHKEPGDTEWGVEPNVNVEMLPSQESDAILARRDADVATALNEMDEDGNPRSDPSRLLHNMDLQLQSAVVLLQTQIQPSAARQAKRD